MDFRPVSAWVTPGMDLDVQASTDVLALGCYIRDGEKADGNTRAQRLLPGHAG